MTVRKACVDIGSNTTRLLVADVDGHALTEVRARRAFAALPPGQPISGDTQRRVARLVAEHVRLARDAGAASVRVVATAAVRDSPDGPALCDAVREASGIEVEVLAEAEEARL